MERLAFLFAKNESSIMFKWVPFVWEAGSRGIKCDWFYFRFLRELEKRQKWGFGSQVKTAWLDSLEKSTTPIEKRNVGQESWEYWGLED